MAQSSPLQTYAFDVQVSVPEEVFTEDSNWHSISWQSLGNMSFTFHLERGWASVLNDDEHSVHSYGSDDDERVEFYPCVLASVEYSVDWARAEHLMTGPFPPSHAAHLKVQCFPADVDGDSEVLADQQIEAESYVLKCVEFKLGRWPGKPFGSLQDLRASGLLTSGDVLHFRIEASMNSPPEIHVWDSPGPADILYDMWRNQEFTDFFVVSLGGHEIKCHRGVVAAASPVFKGMIGGEMQEGLQQFVTIDESPETIRALLEFIYTGKLQDAECCMLVSLLQLSDYFQLPDLTRLCAQRIPPLLSSENIAFVLRRLAPLRHASLSFDDLFHLVVKLVRRNMTLAVTVCSSLGSLYCEERDVPANWHGQNHTQGRRDKDNDDDHSDEDRNDEDDNDEDATGDGNTGVDESPSERQSKSGQTTKCPTAAKLKSGGLQEQRDQTHCANGEACSKHLLHEGGAAPNSGDSASMQPQSTSGHHSPNLQLQADSSRTLAGIGAPPGLEGDVAQANSLNQLVTEANHPADGCQSKQCKKKRKTRRGGAKVKFPIVKDHMSIPDTYNSWE